MDKEKQKEYQREWLAKRRENYFKDKSCVQCGSRDRLELDHIDPEQKVSHRIWSWSQDRREAEIAKCQVLCRDCHESKTQSDTGIEWKQHGTHCMWKRHKCRCAECRAWKAASVKAERARRKERDNASLV